MLPAWMAEALRARGLDAIAIDERPEARGLTDDGVLELAARDGRVVVSLNCTDFLELDRRAHAAGASHNGMILVNTRRFRRRAAGSKEFLDALAALATGDRSLNGHITWLS